MTHFRHSHLESNHEQIYFYSPPKDSVLTQGQLKFRSRFTMLRLNVLISSQPAEATEAPNSLC